MCLQMGPHTHRPCTGPCAHLHRLIHCHAWVHAPPPAPPPMYRSLCAPSPPPLPLAWHPPSEAHLQASQIRCGRSCASVRECMRVQGGEWASACACVDPPSLVHICSLVHQSTCYSLVYLNPFLRTRVFLYRLAHFLALLYIYLTHYIVFPFPPCPSNMLRNQASPFPSPTPLHAPTQIPHLVDLGVNAVELLPVFEYDELEFQRR
jgi:hypothetical protein